MKKWRFVYLVTNIVVLMALVGHADATDVFPEFSTSEVRVYIPIEDIIQAYQEDIEHEVGFNFSYNINGQFMDPGQGHVQTMAEGFSGKSDKGSPWKTLTELLAAYHNADIASVKSLYTPESQEYIEELLSEQAVKERFINYMKVIEGMDIKMGFYHKNGFVAFVDLDLGETAEFRYRLTPFFLVPRGSEYFLSYVKLDEAITANISLFLQLGHTVAELPAPKHGLSVEKSGTGDGTVRGSGIDCGEDCIEVFVEGTAVWLKADGDEYSTFEGWLVGGEPLTDRLVIEEDTTVTAVFTKTPPKEYTLTIETAGTETGTVTDSDTACEPDAENCLELFSFHAGAEDAPVELVGLDCGETCSATYTEGTTVYLNATAAEGFEFKGWALLEDGEAPESPLEISADTTITAIFEEVAAPDEEPTDEEPLPEEPEPEQTQP